MATVALAEISRQVGRVAAGATLKLRLTVGFTIVAWAVLGPVRLREDKHLGEDAQRYKQVSTLGSEMNVD